MDRIAALLQEEEIDDAESKTSKFDEALNEIIDICNQYKLQYKYILL